MLYLCCCFYLFLRLVFRNIFGWASVTICYLSLLCNHYKGCVLKLVATVRHKNPNLIRGPLTRTASNTVPTGPLSRLNTMKTLYQINVDLKLCVKVEKLTLVPKNSHPVLIPQNFGNLIHSFMCWLKFHTKTCTMTSCQDIDIFFMSPVLKKLSPM